MRLYLAGPMRGYADMNFPAFREARERLRLAGHHVICPAELDEREGFVPGQTAVGPEFLRHAMARDLTAICECEGLALLDEWEGSRGVKVEYALAEFLGLDIRPFAAWLPTRMERAQ